MKSDAFAWKNLCCLISVVVLLYDYNKPMRALCAVLFIKVVFLLHRPSLISRAREEALVGRRKRQLIILDCVDDVSRSRTQSVRGAGP